MLFRGRLSQVTALVGAAFFTASAAAAGEPASDSLALDVGGNRSLHVSLQDGQLEVREVGGFGPNQGHVFRSQTLTPARDRLEELWATVEKLGVWKWAAVYRSNKSSAMDGVNWSLKLAHDGHSLTAAGYNAFPERWSEFVAAVQTLAAEPAPSSH